MASKPLSLQDLEDLRYAWSLLENPSLAARIANVVGVPIERGLELLPHGASKIINVATTKLLAAALAFAISTMDERQHVSADWIHKTIVAMTGPSASDITFLIS
jgi:hypothetical protein